ncbi:MAG: YheU family protein [Gammaproteobacteria bacterium]|nr:YheU family protein [Gammaproteobacteria bacterium]
MIIPVSEIRPELLEAIIEQYVLGEGTDYGEREYSLAEKVAHVRSQLENGQAFVVYSQVHETVHIMSREELGHPPVDAADSDEASS